MNAVAGSELATIADGIRVTMLSGSSHSCAVQQLGLL
jgi:hypothetical protein